jgi:uncharacterized protein (UPF0254 family)
LSRSWKVGAYVCTLFVPPMRAGVMHAIIEWDPRQPDSLNREEIAAYRRGRNRALAELSAELGIRSAVVEV